MNQHKYLTLIGLTALLLSGCGGGGGGGASSGGGNAGGGSTPTQIALDAANAPEVAGAVAGTAFSAGELAAGNTLFGVVPDTDAAEFDIAGFTADQIDRIWLLQGSAVSDGVTGVVIPAETIPCSFAGSVTISGDVADPTDITPGDEFNLTFNDGCNEGDGITLNGGFDMVFGTIQGDLLFGGAPYSFAVAVDVSNFSVAAMGESISANGDMNLTLSSQDDIIISTQIAGESLTVTQSGDTSTLSNYDISETFNSFTSVYVTDTNGTFTNTSLGGTVTFSTVTPFQSMGDDFPTLGEMLISGANDSIVYLIADDSGGVTLEVDANGDGMIDETIITTWLEITTL